MFSSFRLDHSPEDPLKADFLGAKLDVVPEQHGTLMFNRLSLRHKFFFQDPHRYPKRFKSDVYKGYKLTGHMMEHVIPRVIYMCDLLICRLWHARGSG